MLVTEGATRSQRTAPSLATAEARNSEMICKGVREFAGREAVGQAPAAGVACVPAATRWNAGSGITPACPPLQTHGPSHISRCVIGKQKKVRSVGAAEDACLKLGLEVYKDRQGVLAQPGLQDARVLILIK